MVSETLYCRLWHDRKLLTRNWHIWAEYLCWCIARWIDVHQPYYPMWLRKRLLCHYPPQRHGMTALQYRFWQRNYPKRDLSQWKPLPWYVGQYGVGPFVRPWRWLYRQFKRHTGSRSHRCEFTDRERGALYGGREGPFMNRYFEQFLRNIENPEQSN